MAVEDKRMKRILVILLVLCVVIPFFGCGAKTMTFDLSDAHNIVICSSSGEKTAVTDPDTVRRLADDIMSLTFIRDRSSKDVNGFGPILQFSDSGDNSLCSFSVSDAQTIACDGYYWIAEGGSIDTGLIDELMKE